MKKLIFILVLSLFSCYQNPVTVFDGKKDMIGAINDSSMSHIYPKKIIVSKKPNGSSVFLKIERTSTNDTTKITYYYE